MQEFQVIGGPDWVRSNRYEVSAKAESATTADRMAQMVKRMLASDCRRIRRCASRTPITETYDIDLEFLPDRGFVPAPPPLGVTQTAETPSLLTALQDQLGLKLESERGPVEVIIIDSVQLPTPN